MNRPFFLIYGLITGLKRSVENFLLGLADNHEAGDVVPGAGGIRKIRWKRKAQGKRGGVRIIYFTELNKGLIWLLTIYAKSNKDNIPAHILKALKEELVDGYK